MDLSIGTRIGLYEITGVLGTGAMGEVYRARDARLARDVALKVLPSSLTRDPDRLARFEREARVLASINHPHIAAIYGLEEAGDRRALVLELVEGVTLAERIASGTLQTRDALRLARQIADALDAAHEKGIVHRDVKPANIRITPKGVAKVLDFGLAKTSAPPEGRGGVPAAELSQAPTLLAAETQAGMIVGSAAYMSPEQARGESIDKRADIWAFGCVLYEMLSGRPAFARPTIADTLAAVIERDPDWQAVPPQTPDAVVRLMRRCLEKDPARRLRDIGDAGAEIEEALSPARAARSSALPVPPARRAWLPFAAVLGTAAAAMVVAVFWTTSGRDDAGSAAVDPLAGATFTRLTDWEGSEQQAAVSRDGQFVAFVSDRDGLWDAWVGQIGTDIFRNLTNGYAPELLNPAVRNVGFTPDASLITLWVRLTDPARGVSTGGWAVPTLGGPLRPYMDRFNDNIADVDWFPEEDRLVYHTSDAGDPIFVTDGSNTNARQVLAAEPPIHNHFPVWSPDGDSVYFVRGIPPFEMDIWRVLVAGGDAERLTSHQSRVSFPTFLDRGTLLYLASAPDGSGPWIHALDVERRVSTRISPGIDEYTSLAASADGRRLVATVSRAIVGLWRADLGAQAATETGTSRVALPTVRGVSPRFGPGFVVYRAPRAGTDSVWRIADGQPPLELWDGRGGRVVGAPTIAPDGRRIAFPVQRQGVTRLYVMNADGTDAGPLTEELDVRGAPDWSPDGQWIAVAADRNGRPALFKVPAAGGGATLVTDDYALDPVWSPSGRFLVYSGVDVGTTFPVKAVTAEGQPHPFPELTLTRGARRLAFLGNDSSLVLLKGDIASKELWTLDLTTGRERPLTEFGSAFMVTDFDLSADGRSVVFDRTRDQSDLVLIERPPGS